MIAGIIKNTLYYFIQILLILIYVRILLSWIPMSRSNKLNSFLYTVTEPLLSPVRKLMNKSIFGGEGYRLDFSPLIVIMIFQSLLMYIGSN
jgi:YggT family protein